MQGTARYGVWLENKVLQPIDEAIETIRLMGYAVVDPGLTSAELAFLREHFDAIRASENASPLATLRREAGEGEMLRCPLSHNPAFLKLAANPVILSICQAMVGSGFILNQQNGIVNPAGSLTYSQSPLHRDLPYQHFVSSRPLAINALFCVDPFTEENGATWVIPASHKEEAFPSEPIIKAQRRQISAPAGSFLVLDCMVWHGGGVNRSNRDRRAVNHLYTMAMMRQQIDLHSFLGDDFTADPKLRQLLGFQHPQPRSAEEYLQFQAAKRAAQRPR